MLHEILTYGLTMTAVSWCLGILVGVVEIARAQAGSEHASS
jgi:hypothetical protein